jgi:SAM-dependent methyltransferase
MAKSVLINHFDEELRERAVQNVGNFGSYRTFDNVDAFFDSQTNVAEDYAILKLKGDDVNNNNCIDIIGFACQNQQGFNDVFVGGFNPFPQPPPDSVLAEARDLLKENVRLVYSDWVDPQGVIKGLYDSIINLPLNSKMTTFNDIFSRMKGMTLEQMSSMEGMKTLSDDLDVPFLNMVESDEFVHYVHSRLFRQQYLEFSDLLYEGLKEANAEIILYPIPTKLPHLDLKVDRK